MTWDEKDPHLNRPNVAAVEGEDGEDGERWQFRASAFGGCQTSLAYDLAAEQGWFEAQKAEPDEWLQATWDESAAFEQGAFDLWLDATDGKWPEDDTADLKCTLPIGSSQIMGTMDFVVQGESGERKVVEIKVVGEKLAEQLDAAKFVPWEDLPDGLVKKYRMQVALYLYATGYEWGALVWATKYKGGLTGEVNWVWCRRDSMLPTLDDIKHRATAIVELAQFVYNGTDVVCDHGDSKCPWADLCAKPGTMTVEQERVLTRYQSAMRSMNAYADVVKALKADLLAGVEDAPTGRLVSRDGTKVTIVEQHVPERVQTIKAHDKKYVKITPPKDKEQEQ
jgi:hypothetical protein